MRRADVIAGIAVAGLLLPEAVAYATIAGLPAGRAIMAGIVGCLAYAAVGQSRFAIVSPTSSAAAILAATLAAMPGDREALATAAILLTGLFFIAASVLRLGGLTSLIPRPVLQGFSFGIALTIIVRQMPAMVGVAIHAPDPFRLLIALVGAASAWNWVSIAAGLAALAGFLGLKRYPALPGALIVLLAGMVASHAFGLGARGVETVGPITLAVGLPRVPVLTLDDWSRLASYVLPLVLILFAESWGTISGLAGAHGDRVTANRELAALGAANLASALVQGMPVGAGFSAGAASEGSGATSRAAAVSAALGLAALVVVARPLVAGLPAPVLAAVVIGTLAHSLRPDPFLRLLRLGRDLPLALGAAGAVLVLGVLNGMLFAVAVSLGAMLHRLASPRFALLGRLGDSRNFVDLARHPDAAAPPDAAIFRPSEPIFFGNAAAIFDAITAEVLAAHGLKQVILSLEESFDLDSTAFDALLAFDARLRATGLAVHFARVHDHVRDVLTAGGAKDFLSRSSYSVDDAISGFEKPRRDPADET